MQLSTVIIIIICLHFINIVHCYAKLKYNLKNIM